jgi:hypothetical protein
MLSVICRPTMCIFLTGEINEKFRSKGLLVIKEMITKITDALAARDRKEGMVNCVDRLLKISRKGIPAEFFAC